MEGSVTGSRRGQERASVRLALGRWKDALGVGAYLLPPVIALALAAAVWELWVRIGGVAEYLVPAPSAVLSDLFVDIEYFAFHGAITLAESLGGFAMGATVAITGAIIMSQSRALERSLLPLAVLVKVTPIVAVAPLFVIWFGFGSFPKILVASLITFFPVLVNTLAGLRSASPEALDLFKSLDASNAEVLWKLRGFSALPFMFAAFRIAVPLSVIGAVVGEWFTGDRGLGSVIIVAHNDLNMPRLFASVVVLAVIGISLTALTWYGEKRILFWHESERAV